MIKEKTQVSINYDHEVNTLIKGVPKRVYLLLHGYLLDGEFMINKFKDYLPSDSLIISPNAPFPVPVKKKEFYIPKYAWYFFDSTLKKYYIGLEPAKDFIKSILVKFNPENLPITVIGYSQGGYLAPKIAELEFPIEKVIGIACTFRNKNFEYSPKVSYHQIHGIDDIIVDPANSQEEFSELKKLGNIGEYHLLESTTHKIDENILVKLKTILPV
jgi:predicted esterase